MNSPYMINGSWIDALDILRGLDCLKECNGIVHALGGGFGGVGNYIRGRLEKDKEIKDYILKRSENNPLREFKFDAD